MPKIELLIEDIRTQRDISEDALAPIDTHPHFVLAVLVLDLSAFAHVPVVSDEVGELRTLVP